MTHLVRERVLLVEQHTDEERRCAVVRKLRQLEQRYRGVVRRNRHLGDGW